MFDLPTTVCYVRDVVQYVEAGHYYKEILSCTCMCYFCTCLCYCSSPLTLPGIRFEHVFCVQPAGALTERWD